MPTGRRRVWLAAVLLAVACEDGQRRGRTAPAPDGGPEAEDAAAPRDVATLDAGPNGLPDAGADVAHADAGADVAPDAEAGTDVGVPWLRPRDLDWPALQWAACDPPLADPEAECSVLEVPLDWDDPAGARVPAAVARRRASVRRRGQLWLLNGGPGGTGSQLATMLGRFAAGLPDLDLYLPDHRGTGRSGRLGCAAQEAPDSELGVALAESEWAGCGQAARAEHGQRLPHADVSAAARDVLALVAATREEDDMVLLWGVSYGTLWADRILRIDDGTIDAVVLDSVCTPGLCRADTFDVVFEEQAAAWWAGCAKDAACAERLGEDPWATTVDVFTRVAGGHCAAALEGFGPSDRHGLTPVFTVRSTQSSIASLLRLQPIERQS